MHSSLNSSSLKSVQFVITEKRLPLYVYDALEISIKEFCSTVREVMLQEYETDLIGSTDHQEWILDHVWSGSMPSEKKKNGI